MDFSPSLPCEERTEVLDYFSASRDQRLQPGADFLHVRPRVEGGDAEIAFARRTEAGTGSDGLGDDDIGAAHADESTVFRKQARLNGAVRRAFDSILALAKSVPSPDLVPDDCEFRQSALRGRLKNQRFARFVRFVVPKSS